MFPRPLLQAARSTQKAPARPRQDPGKTLARLGKTQGFFGKLPFRLENLPTKNGENVRQDFGPAHPFIILKAGRVLRSLQMPFRVSLLEFQHAVVSRILARICV